MKISVVMPIRDCLPYLAAALDSLLAQTRPADEILLIEDGSTDGTLALAEHYAGRHPSIRLVADGETRGCTARLNQGLALATGDLIARMDGDDIAEPTRFEKQSAYLAGAPEVGLLGTFVTLIDPEGAPLHVPVIPTRHDALDRALLNGEGQFVFHSSVMMRAAVVRAVGGYDEAHKRAQDLDLFLKVAEVARIENLPEPLVRYRHHFSSAGYADVAAQEAAITHFLREARRRRGLMPDLPPRDVRPHTRPRWEAHSRWAWWALGAGNVVTARKHAWKLVRQRPASLETARLAYCVLRQSLRDGRAGQADPRRSYRNPEEGARKAGRRFYGRVT